MSKNFDDFMKQCNNKDWSNVVSKISNNTNYEDTVTAIFHANLEMTLTVLREYHNWLNS